MIENSKLIVKKLPGLQDYVSTWQAMKDFTNQRNAHTPDEIWLLEHPPVYTQGQNGKPEHILNPGTIPIIQVDRGGQVTYHGPGQIVAYFLLDLKRRNLTIRKLVTAIEQATINTLADYQVFAQNDPHAPGIYVSGAKIASLGLRIRKGYSYHGLAFNIKMDMTPFTHINPCGLKGIRMVQLSDWKPDINLSEVEDKLIKHFDEYTQTT